MFCLSGSGDPPHLHSCPPRRSSDLARPDTTRFTFPSWCRSNTTMGRLLSRHRAKAVESITLMSFLSASSKLTRSYFRARSEEHTSELQSRRDRVCRLRLEKKNTNTL